MFVSENSGPSTMGRPQIRPASTTSKTMKTIAMTFTAVGTPTLLSAIASRRELGRP